MSGRVRRFLVSSAHVSCVASVGAVRVRMHRAQRGLAISVEANPFPILAGRFVGRVRLRASPCSSLPKKHRQQQWASGWSDASSSIGEQRIVQQQSLVLGNASSGPLPAHTAGPFVGRLSARLLPCLSPETACGPEPAEAGGRARRAAPASTPFSLAPTFFLNDDDDDDDALEIDDPTLDGTFPPLVPAPPRTLPRLKEAARRFLNCALALQPLVHCPSTRRFQSPFQNRCPSPRALARGARPPNQPPINFFHLSSWN